MEQQQKQLILASQSPRRKELLAQLGYQFSCHPADINEDVIDSELARNYVERMAREKAGAVAKLYPDSCLILGSDTSVIIDDVILGKPKDKSDAINMLSRLSDNTHQVITSIAVAHQQQISSGIIVTDVVFKALTQREMERYWQTKEPQDKAGSYGIQGLGGQFVKQIQGSYSSVVGLPLYETARLLGEFGLKTPVQA